MPLIDKINSDLKAAMLAKEKEKLEAIRAIKAALLILNTSGEDVNQEAEIKLIQRLIKQRKEAAEIYTNNNRQDLADIELSQVVFIQEYLPAQLSNEEIKTLISEIISQNNATSIKDMGKVMGIASKKLAGKADNKTISEIVKILLS